MEVVLTRQNLVRKSLYYNYDYYLNEGEGAFGDPAETLKWHVCE